MAYIRKWKISGRLCRQIRAARLKINPLRPLPNLAAAAPASRLSASDLERCQMSSNVVGIERRAGESADRVGRVGELAVAPKRRVIEIRPEYRLGDPKRLRADRSLTPAHHLRIEPG